MHRAAPLFLVLIVADLRSFRLHPQLRKTGNPEAVFVMSALGALQRPPRQPLLHRRSSLY